MTNQILLLLAGFTFFPTVNILKETKVYLNKDLQFQMFWCHSWRLKMFPVTFDFEPTYIKEVQYNYSQTCLNDQLFKATACA